MMLMYCFGCVVYVYCGLGVYYYMGIEVGNVYGCVFWLDRKGWFDVG